MFKQIMLGALCAGMVTPFASSASTIGEEVDRKKTLGQLDHTIQVNQRLLEIQKQEIEFDELKSGSSKGSKREGNRQNRQSNDGQVQYFGQVPPGNGSGQGGQQRLNPDGTLVREVKSPEQIRREEALSLVNNATLREAFVPPGKDRLVGIIELSDRVVEAHVGTVINEWKVVSVNLGSVSLRHDDLDLEKTVYQAR